MPQSSLHFSNFSILVTIASLNANQHFSNKQGIWERRRYHHRLKISNYVCYKRASCGLQNMKIQSAYNSLIFRGPKTASWPSWTTPSGLRYPCSGGFWIFFFFFCLKLDRDLSTGFDGLVFSQTKWNSLGEGRFEPCMFWRFSLKGRPAANTVVTLCCAGANLGSYLARV